MIKQFFCGNKKLPYPFSAKSGHFLKKLPKISKYVFFMVLKKCHRGSRGVSQEVTKSYGREEGDSRKVRGEGQSKATKSDGGKGSRNPSQIEMIIEMSVSNFTFFW